jgi:hypothetical protein
MNKLWKVVKEILSIVAVLTVIIGGGIFIKNQIPNLPQTLGRASTFTMIDTLTQTATTTGSFCTECPVKLLDVNPNRQYAAISNTGNEAVFLFATSSNLDYSIDSSSENSALIATSTIQFPLSGILLNASSTYIITADNLITGYLWASSSTQNVQINVSQL